MGILPDWMIERDVKITPKPAPSGTKHPGQLSHGYSSYGVDVRCGYKFKIFSPVHAVEIDPKNFDARALEEVDLTPLQRPLCPYCCGSGEGELRGDTCRECKGTGDVDPVDQKPNFVRIPPHSFALAESLEEFDIPRDVLCIVVGKSSYARCGLIVNVTPGEPEWRGRWTIEISNTTPLPARVYAGEGIMQALFLRSEGIRELEARQLGTNPHDPEARRAAACSVSYADKKGRYAGQTGITLPFVEGHK